MKTQEFFEVALPSDGYYCAVGIKDNITSHKFTSGIAGLLEATQEFNSSGHDTYFACHTFSEKRRLQEYAKQVRSFYLDIDCGEQKAKDGKGYATKNDAVVALKLFCKDAKLPKPFIIDSGRGLHVYWMLDNPLARDEWSPIAKAFKTMAKAKGLIIDPAVPADSARILRVPGTKNYKDANDPKDVVLLQRGTITQIDKFNAAVAGYEVKSVPKLPALKRPMDDTTRALMGNFNSNFGLLARKSLKGTGCVQIKHILENKANQSYDLWLAALTIAVKCDDGDSAIHKLSNGHPEYDPDVTEQKAEHARSMGPRTCAWYRIESDNAEACKSCQHKITSPIQLGRVLKDSTDESTSAPAPATLGIDLDNTDIPELENERVLEPPPALPFPYTRGANGGIYRRDKGVDGEVEDVLVTEDDLFVIKRIVDPVDGVCAVLRLHSPHDPVSEFAVPLKTLQAFDKFRDVMSEKGVVANKKGMENLMAYTTSFVRSLRTMIKADEARTQFGWVDGNAKFILGEREISDTGVGYSPPSSVTKELAPFLEPKGELDKWRAAFNMYVGVPNSEAQVFALLSSFGSPIVKFSGMAGSLISLVHTTSGTGKTTILRLVNSVWGHPDELMQLNKDTINAKQHRMGVMNCLPNCFDEVTNMKSDELSEMVYGISQGRGRNRMRADTNAERVNKTRWSNISICSGNAAIVDRLGAYKATSEGEQMRVMEFKVELIEVAGAADLLAELHNNYGHAGTVFAQALVKHRNNITKFIDKIRKDVIVGMGAAVKERYWVNTIATTFVGAHIAQRLGLHDYDLEHLFNWIISHAKTRRTLVSSHIVAPGDMLGEYLLENFGSTLTVNMTKINQNTLSNVIKPAYNRIAARFETDTNRIFIPKKDFKDYCVKRQGDMETVLFSHNDDYEYLGTKKKRMATGTGSASPAVDVFEFAVSGGLLESLTTTVKADA